MMGMGLDLEIRPRMALRLALVCSICKQEFIEERRKRTMTLALLFGMKQYAVCTGCLQPVPRRAWTHGYKCRWTIRWRKKVLALQREEAKA